MIKFIDSRWSKYTPTVSKQPNGSSQNWHIREIPIDEKQRGYLSDDEFKIQFPDEVNENTRVVVAYRGANSVGDVDSVFTAAEGQNVIVIAPINEANNEYNNNYETAIKMANSLTDEDSKLVQSLAANGVNFNGTPSSSSITYSAHSNSSKEIINAASNFLTYEHQQGNQTRTSIVLYDPERTPLVNSNTSKNISEFDDSFIFTEVQQQYIKTDGDGNITGAQGGFLSYKADLETLAKAGATVVVMGYDMDPDGWKPHPPSDNWHTESVEMSSVMGLFDIERGILDDGPLSFVSAKNNGKSMITEFKYYYFDVEQNAWVTFPSSVEAQALVDIASTKVSMYNAGMLSKADGKYTITLNGESREISPENLDSFLLAFKEKYRDSGQMDEKTFEEFMEEFSKFDPRGSDEAQGNLKNVENVCWLLKETMGDIGMHMKSFGSLPALSNKSTGELSKYLENMNAFPKGVNTSSFESSMECVNKLGSNIEKAYNASIGVYNAWVAAESSAPTFFQSNTFGDAANQASEDVTNFAQDLQ